VRIGTNEEDCLECPHCGALLAGYEDDVTDSDFHDESKDVAAEPCPSCGKRIALIRTHFYQLGKFKE